MKKLLVAALLVAALPAQAKPSRKPPRVATVEATPPAPPAPDPTAEKVRAAEARLRCLEEQGRLQAEIQRKTATCLAQAETARQCIARVRDRQVSSTGRGALIGLGAALVTGGASLLYTGAGALVGHAASDQASGECGEVPACDAGSVSAAAALETGLRPRTCPAG